MKYKPKKQHMRLIKAGFFSLLLIPLFIFINHLLKSYPVQVEKYYTSSVFKTVSGIYGFFTNLIPISLIEIFMFAFPLSLIIILIRTYRKSKITNRLLPLVRLLSALCATISVFFVIFTCGLSFNYSRPQASSLLGLDTENLTKEELSQAFTYTIGKLNEIVPQISYNEKGQSSYQSFLELSKQGANAFSKLSQENPVFGGMRVRAKPMLALSIVMNYMGVTGIYSPFTNEANVNILFPDFSLPQTMCHEISHLRGFMREDEAEYVGYLACVKSDDIYFNYSGYMYAFNSIGNALYKTDKALYKQLAATAPAEALKEWKLYFEYANRFEGKVTEIATKANNSYLKSQGQSDGVISYSRSVKLILGQMRKDNIV